MKKLLLIAGASLLSFAPLALAQSGFVSLAPIPGLTDAANTSVVNSSSLANFFNNLYKYLIGLAAAIAVIQIIWAGLDIAYFHKDAVGTITDDKGKIYNALFGLVLVLSPVLVFSIINPSILNLSLNLPPLDTKSGGTPSAVTPYVQESVRAGSLNAVNNGQLVGFKEDYYASPQSGVYCFQLKDGTVADGRSYFCARDSNGCRTIYNDFNNSGATPQSQCTKY